MQPPQYAQNTITKYHMSSKNHYGTYRHEEKYDLLSVIMIRLGQNNKEEQPELLAMLGTLLSEELRTDEKLKILETDYHIPRTRKMEEEAVEMCNLSDIIEEKGIEKGIHQSVLKLHQKNMDAKQIAFLLDINEQEVKQILDENLQMA